MKESELDEMQTVLVKASEEALTTMKALTEVAKKANVVSIGCVICHPNWS